MSCGNHHDTECSEVLDHLYEYLDNEMGEGDCAKLREHFDECSPCLEKYGLEQAIKALVKRSCGCDTAPSDLRGKVLARIERIRAGLPVEGDLVAHTAPAGGAAADAESSAASPVPTPAADSGPGRDAASYVAAEAVARD
ncbi:mycothiol system anti-sigma-R factor [Streptacidiphilus sp. PB12-B1b]|uniref:mycothiol system anti-sigma-R factor n=1 Tax=Streptacidiphilus sp. PB12-B1b TaxID=2705012 RepID=UPI0015F8CEAF|nr:mycothiol system anti-sigma-R factor [Streptacidiphilus sp. PB12-B1b]QMU75252.1 mycothiol system anti-sigma-R factor [Streptacidiphilus sp. PB12-B1b]